MERSSGEDFCVSSILQYCSKWYGLFLQGTRNELWCYLRLYAIPSRLFQTKSHEPSSAVFPCKPLVSYHLRSHQTLPVFPTELGLQPCWLKCSAGRIPGEPYPWVGQRGRKVHGVWRSSAEQMARPRHNDTAKPGSLYHSRGVQ